MTLKEPKFGLMIFLFLGAVCWLATDVVSQESGGGSSGSSSSGSSSSGSTSSSDGTFSSAAPMGSGNTLPGTINSAFEAQSPTVSGVNRPTVFDSGAPNTVSSTQDSRLRAEVMETLTADGSFSATPIEAEVSAGTLRLTGTVGSQEEKQRAQEHASRTEGITSVRNDIVVDTDLEGRGGVLVST